MYPWRPVFVVVGINVVLWSYASIMNDVSGHVPLSVRRGIRAPFRLVEGVPEHLASALRTWALDHFRARGEPYVHLVRSTLRLRGTSRRASDLVLAAAQDEDLFLDLIDYTVRDASDNAVGELEMYLDAAGSVWKVAEGGEGLEHRVPAETTAMYERVLAQEDDAAHRMSEAWRNMFGRDVDARQAWHEAVCAVEAILGPIVIPKGTHQLGKIVPAIRQAPEGKFTFRLPGGDPRQTLLDMLAGVTYQPGRHAGAGAPVDPTVAKAVVFQAAAIVAAVSEGAIAVNEEQS